MGIVTGKFLEKGVHLNQLTGELFKWEDLNVGGRIKVYNREFELIEMDDYTKRFIETHDNHRPYELGAVLEKLRESMRQQYPLVRDIFRKFDMDHDGVITFPEFNKALEKFGFQLSEPEAMVVMKHFDTRGDGQISYNEFCDVLLDEDYTTDMMKTKAPLKEEYDHSYAERATQRFMEREETEKVRTAARALGDVFLQQAQTFQKLFREFSHLTHVNTVSVKQIVYALEQIGRSVSEEDVIRCVLYVLPKADLNKIRYVDLLQGIRTTFHDLAAVR